MNQPALPTPQPPGALDQLPEPAHVLFFLDQFNTWLADRRRQLDALDRALLSRPDPGAQTGDLMVALSVWQALQQRQELLARTWDSGRVGPLQQRQLAQLMWGRLDEDPLADPTPAPPPPASPLDLDPPSAPAPAAPRPASRPAPASPTGARLSVNLPEACRLLDALLAQLSTQLRLTPQGTQWAIRLTGLRAQAERLRDQVQLEPPARRAASAQAVAAVADDIAAVADKAERGGDIGGLLGPLEIRAARLERDLIVGNAQRRRVEAKAAALERRRRGLAARAEAVARLVQTVRESVQPAPKYAVPNLAALGPVPAEETGLDAYDERLDQVGRALGVVEEANQAALAGLAQLRSEWADLSGRATPADPAAAALADQAAALLGRSPTPVAVVRPVLAAYRAALAAGPRP